MPLRARTALHTQIHGRQNAHALHRRCTRAAHAPRMHCTGPAQALHDLPLLRVRQHGVRLGNCFELGLRLLLHFRLVLIRVPLEAQLAEGLLDLALARGALDAKDLVVVSTCSRGSWALWSPVSSRALSVRADDEQRDEQAQPPGTAHVARSSLPRARRRPRVKRGRGGNMVGNKLWNPEVPIQALSPRASGAIKSGVHTRRALVRAECMVCRLSRRLVCGLREPRCVLNNTPLIISRPRLRLRAEG